MTHKLKKLEPLLLALIFWEKTTQAFDIWRKKNHVKNRVKPNPNHDEP